MAVLTKSSTVIIGTKQVDVEEILKTLIYLPAEKVVEFFQNIGLLVPRKLRMVALRIVLDGVVKTKQVVLQTLSDEVNYRLSWYENFSESQLEGLLPMFKDDDLEETYRENLWLRLLTYIFDKQVSEENVLSLISDSKTHYVHLGPVFEDIVYYNKALAPMFYDEPNKIDGLSPEIFRPVLYKSSTLVEIREIGKKFGVDVPRRLKKNELQSIIIRELKANNEHTPEVEEKVKKMAVIALQRFAIDHKIKASIELKKEEIIEYILANYEGTKELYFIPEHPGVYEQIIVSDEKPTPEIIIAPEVVEEVIVEPTEVEIVIETVEPIVEEPQETVLAEENESLDKELEDEHIHIHDENCDHEHEQEFYVEMNTDEIMKELHEIKAELAKLKAKDMVEEDRPALDTISVNAYETKLSSKDWRKVAQTEKDILSEQSSDVQEVPRDINSLFGIEPEQPIVESKFRKTMKWIFRGLLILLLILFILAMLKGFTGFELGFVTNNPVSDQVAIFFAWLKDIITTIIG